MAAQAQRSQSLRTTRRDAGRQASDPWAYRRMNGAQRMTLPKPKKPVGTGQTRRRARLMLDTPFRRSVSLGRRTADPFLLAWIPIPSNCPNGSARSFQPRILQPRIPVPESEAYVFCQELLTDPKGIAARGQSAAGKRDRSNLVARGIVAEEFFHKRSQRKQRLGRGN